MGGDFEAGEMGGDVGEPAGAVLMVAGGGFEVGDLLTPPGVEGVHVKFANVFAGHGGQGGGEGIGFALFAESEEGSSFALRRGLGEEVGTGLGGFAEDLEVGVGEGLEEEVGVVVAAALFVDDDDEAAVGVGGVEVVEVGEGDGHERGGLVVGGVDERVVRRLGEDGGAQGQGADAGLGEGGVEDVEGDGKIAGVGEVGEGWVEGGVPGVRGEVVVGAGKEGQERGRGEGRGGGIGGAEEGEDGAFEEFVAIGEVVDEFGVGDEEAGLGALIFLGDGGTEELPEAGDGVGGIAPPYREVAGDFECRGGDHQRSEERAVTCFVNASENHGGGF